MSYILDALRKSQQARQPGAPPARGAVHGISLSLPVSGWWLALGIVLLLGLVAAALIFWRGTVANLPDTPADPMPGEPVKAAAEVEAPVAIEKSAPPLETPAKKTTSVADLAEQARVPVPVTPPKKITATRSGKKIVANRRSEATGISAAVPAVPVVADHTPLLQQMPPEFQRALPSLTVTIHVYSQEESQRILFINNREYRQGSQIEGGIRVEDIVPDGAVLSYGGERFKLSRPR